MRRATIAVLAAAAEPAFATNGYFSHGYGTHYKGMAGAGAALHLSSLAPATNPAAMAFLGPRFDASLGLFNPNRSYNVIGNPSGFPGTFGLTPGEVESESRYFPIPAFGANFSVGEKAAFRRDRAAPDRRVLQARPRHAGDQPRDHLGVLEEGHRRQPARGAAGAVDPAEDGPGGLRAVLVVRDQEVRRPSLVAVALAVAGP